MLKLKAYFTNEVEPWIESGFVYLNSTLAKASEFNLFEQWPNNLWAGYNWPDPTHEQP